ncbi:hypothetical protein Taro_023557 [Colocasia esculenta]|uniref:Uncharacterized protein n=1 Tax=Colocasia esculenta TaxID=4460 RepID=A0A843V8P1_COLES|nr:hypothetical protein [Colocasia esculenta]
MSSAQPGGYAGGFLGDWTYWSLVRRVLAARTLCGAGETSCGLHTSLASRSGAAAGPSVRGCETERPMHTM